MKKKPRKPRTLWFDKHYASGISVNTGAGMVVVTMKAEVLDLNQAKRLMKWLKQATEYLEMKENKK